jgi:general secretion pathway protein G
MLHKKSSGFTLIRESCKGFTLIELLVTIAIIGILSGIAIFGLQGVREQARDAKRKADLESIRSALEIYRGDCNSYPATGRVTSGSQLVGVGGVGCNNNVYMQSVPTDPQTGRSYGYRLISPTTYELCTSLEQIPTTPAACGVSCGSTCNVRTTNP